MSSRSALTAASASVPLASMSTDEPLPAASIITPMMLLAFTRRLLRVSQISQANLLASWVSLADARACRPSLLMMGASALAIARVAVDVDHAFGAAGDRLVAHLGKRGVAIGE